MLPAGHHLWKLSQGGSESLGLHCTEDGLFLAATPLVERRPSGYVLRAQADLARLLKRAYGAEITPARLMPGLGVVAAALAENNLCLAQIAAIQLRLPDVPDLPARRDMEAEDRLLKRERRDGLLARVGWDPAEHPRAGVSPNRAWFAPVGAGGTVTPTQLAHNEENERALEEMLDPLAPGGNVDVRMLSDGMQTARRAFDYLRVPLEITLYVSIGHSSFPRKAGTQRSKGSNGSLDPRFPRGRR